MKSSIHKKAIIFFMMAMLVSWVNASEVFFEVSGWVKKDEVSVRRALVTIFEGEERVAEVKTNRWGNFNIELPAGREYTLCISVEGAIEKKIVFHAQTEKELDTEKDYFVEFIVDIFDPESSHESAFLHHQLIFDPLQDEFIYLQPNVSEYLLIDTEERVSSGSIECCESDDIVS